MKVSVRFFLGGLFGIALLSGHVPAGSAQGAQMAASDKLPPGFASLVPQGYKLVSPGFTKYGTMAGITFVASRQFQNRHSVFFSEYHLDLNLMEKPKELIKMQAPMYRRQLEKDIETERPKAASDATVQRDPPEVKTYPWGAAITQRITHKDVGVGKNPDEIEYKCVYLGLMVGETSIKKFKLLVFGVATREEADQWAAKVVEKIGKSSIQNIGE